MDGWALDAAGAPYLKVRVAAPPVEGEANAALIALLAKTLGRPRSHLSIVSGAGARIKQVEVPALTEGDLAAALGAPPAGIGLT